MNAKFLGAAAVLAALGCAAPASATIITAIDTGTIYQSSDPHGLFGPAGGDLVGKSFVARWLFDTTKGSRVTNSGADALDGGASARATVTINGHSLSLGGFSDSEIAAFYFNNIYGTDHAADIYDPGNGTLTQLTTWAYSHDPKIIPQSITVPFQYNFPKNFFVHSMGFEKDFLILQKIVGDTYFYETVRDTYVYATLDKMTVSTGVPEPSTWALLLLGFGGLGFAGHRRATQNKAPAATA